MTLQSSPPISLGDVANELGIALPLSLGDSRVLTLAGKSGPPISLSDLLGKGSGGASGGGSANVNVTSTQQNYSYSGGGTIGYSYVISKVGSVDTEFLLLVDGGALSHLASFVYNGTTHNGPFTNNQQVELVAAAPGNVTVTFNF